MSESTTPSSTARTLVLVLALFGVATTGLVGLFSVGSAAANVQRVEHAQRLRRRVPHTAIVEARQSKWLAGALLAGAVLGLLGVALVDRPRVAGAALLLAFALPVPFALWAFCPATPFLFACLMTFRIRPPPAPAQS